MARSRNRRQHNRNSRKQCGGKYIGEGTYGCVFSPPIINADIPFKEPANDKYISKILSEDASHAELNIQTLIKAVDPHNHFFLTYKNVYPLNTFHKTDQDGKMKCLPNCGITALNKRNIQETDSLCSYNPSNLVNITYENGGVALDGLLHNKAIQLKDLMVPFYGLICGLCMLLKTYNSSNGTIIKPSIIHGDIKKDNVLYDQSHKRLRYIDLGLSIYSNTLFTNTLFNQQNCYREHPYDFYFFTKAYHSLYLGSPSPVETKVLAIRKEFVEFMIKTEGTRDTTRLMAVQRQISDDIRNRRPTPYTEFLMITKANEVIQFLETNNFTWDNMPFRQYIVSQYFAVNHQDVLYEFGSFIAFIICNYNDKDVRRQTGLKIVETFDTFSLGKIMMESVIALIGTSPSHNQDVFKDFADICYLMKRLDPYLRITPTNLIEKYEQFLLKHKLTDSGLLVKLRSYV